MVKPAGQELLGGGEELAGEGEGRLVVAGESGLVGGRERRLAKRFPGLRAGGRRVKAGLVEGAADRVGRAQEAGGLLGAGREVTVIVTAPADGIHGARVERGGQAGVLPP